MGTGDTQAHVTHRHRRQAGTEDMGTGDTRAQVTHEHRCSRFIRAGVGLWPR